MNQWIEILGLLQEFLFLLYTKSPDANFGALQARYGTTLYAKGLKGTLGVPPVLKALGSIIFKNSITATGAADVKAEGGQIFS